MKLPGKVDERHELYRELVSRCRVSRNERTAQYRRRRRWYLLGTDGMDQARFNKLYAHVDTLSSYLYAQETTKFAIAIPTRLGEQRTAEAAIIRQRFMELWHESDTDLRFGVGLKWSLVYNTMLVKVLAVRGMPEIRLVEPTHFGVLREDVTDLDEQEAYAHWYAMSLSELERRLEEHPKRKELMTWLEGQARAGADTETPESMPPAMSRLVLSQSTPSMIGSAALGPASDPADPQVDEPLVDLVELWVWDDDLDDYRVPVLDSTGHVLWDRKNPTLPHESSIVAITPEPDIHYFWGHSEIEPLIPLQLWRERRMNQIDELLVRQLKPPRSFQGFAGITDEKARALNRADGVLTNPMGQGKIDTHAPQMPPDAFAEIQHLDNMFGEAGGLPPILQGVGEAGTRSGGQAGVQATIASARTRKRALMIEDTLESIATKMLRLLRRLDDTVYRTPKNDEFLLAQMPLDMTVRVSAHTSSPLYQDTIMAKADLLHKAGAIDLVTLIEMVDPPQAEQLMTKARRIQEAQAEMAKTKLQLEAEKIKARGARSR